MTAFGLGTGMGANGDNRFYLQFYSRHSLLLQGYVLCLCIPRLIYREGAEPRVHFEVQFGWLWILLCASVHNLYGV